MEELLERDDTSTIFKDQLNIFRSKAPDGTVVPAAGFPTYPDNFTRDGLLTGFLADDAQLLSAQFEYSTRYQGTRNDPTTGEMPGRIHHQMPGTLLRNNKYTTYAACDTTPMTIIAAERLSTSGISAHRKLVESRWENVMRAIGHVSSLVENNIYWERPPEGANGFGLYVTNWQDSILPDHNGTVEKKEPVYPVAYPHPHFIAARALLSASRMLESEELSQQADAMYRAGISQFMRPEGHVVYIDQQSELVQSSSNELQSLAYIPPEYTELLPLEAIKKRARELATLIGYVTTHPDVASRLSDPYHADAVWTQAQAEIHHGTKKHGLEEEAEVAARVSDKILDGQELFGIKRLNNGNAIPIPKGNNRQAWSVAARLYFTGASDLSWL